MSLSQLSVVSKVIEKCRACCRSSRGEQSCCREQIWPYVPLISIKVPCFYSEKYSTVQRRVVSSDTMCVSVFCSFFVLLWFPQCRKAVRFLSLPVTAVGLNVLSNSSSSVTNCFCSPHLKMLVECEKEFFTSQCSRGIHQLDMKVEKYLSAICGSNSCVFVCLYTYMNKISTLGCIYSSVCVSVSACVTQFLVSRELPQNYWVPGQLRQWQRACWLSAGEQRSSVQWAWVPHTPSAASPGCSSPPCPTAMVHYLQNGKKNFRMTAIMC